MSETEQDGQLYTLGLLEQLRAECKSLWGASSEAHFRVDGLLRELANPNLHDIPTNLPYRVEMWDRHDAHIRWVISASSSVSIGHAALDVAISNFPSERFTLRNRALVIRRHPSAPRGHELFCGANPLKNTKGVNQDPHRLAAARSPRTLQQMHRPEWL
jgi:hypothetical protein